MSLATTKLSLDPVRAGADAQDPASAPREFPQAAEGAELRRPDHGARRGSRPLVRVQGRHRSLARRAAPEARLQADVQECRHRRRAAHPADQLAAPDQRAEGFRAERRRAGGPHQLVRADRDDEPVRRIEDGHADAGRLDALLQHDQRRSGLHLRQGRQDHPHDADRPHGRGWRVLDHRGEGREARRRRARRLLPLTVRMRSPSSIRPTACSIR